MLMLRMYFPWPIAAKKHNENEKGMCDPGKKT